MTKRSAIPFLTCLALLVGVGLCAHATPALAEVCDKIAGEEWTRDQGAMGMSITTQALIILGLFGFAMVMKRDWLTMLLFGCMAFMAVLSVVGQDEHPVVRMAIEEGCLRAKRPWDFILSAVAAIAFAWLALRQTFFDLKALKV